MNAALEAAADLRRADGMSVYTIPGAIEPTGALGYVNCAMELLGQANDRQLHVDSIIHATGRRAHRQVLLSG